MKKCIVAIAVFGLTVMGLGSPAAGGGRWPAQVTGGVEARAGGTDFTVAVSARLDSDGTAKGQVQYTRAGLRVHIAVDCMYVSQDGIAVAGPVKVQDGTWHHDRTFVALNADGSRLRVASGPSDAASYCGFGTSFPGEVTAGSFHVRT